MIYKVLPRNESLMPSRILNLDRGHDWSSNDRPSYLEVGYIAVFTVSIAPCVRGESWVSV